jgi:hypothetical protein
MYQRILTDPLQFPLEMGPEARSVMTGLLQRDPSKRLGANGGEEIKRHPFFAKYIDWNRYLQSHLFFFNCSHSRIGYWRNAIHPHSSPAWSLCWMWQTLILISRMRRLRTLWSQIRNFRRLYRISSEDSRTTLPMSISVRACSTPVPCRYGRDI